MRLSRDVVSRLTPTEKRIVEYFARHGGSAREIAEALGVSERTVYKALYRYRKVARSLGVDASGFYFRGRRGRGASPPQRTSPLGGESSGRDEEIVVLLRRILLELEKISRSLERLSQGGVPVGPRGFAGREVEAEPVLSGGGLPSFADGNPWLNVLSRRNARKY